MPAKRYQDEREPSILSIHPNKLYLYLLLLSLTVLFVGFALAYVYTRHQNGATGIYLPPVFIVNSVILLASSWTINRANKAYLADDTRGYQIALIGTMFTTLLFLVAQLVAWTLMKDQLLGAEIGNGKQYLYAISGLHFAHVVGGIPFLGLFMYTAYKRMKEPVSVLIYFSDPEKRLKLQLLTSYWHFLDGLWLFLVGFFLLNMAF